MLLSLTCYVSCTMFSFVLGCLEILETVWPFVGEALWVGVAEDDIFEVALVSCSFDEIIYLCKGCCNFFSVSCSFL